MNRVDELLNMAAMELDLASQVRETDNKKFKEHMDNYSLLRKQADEEERHEAELLSKQQHDELEMMRLEYEKKKDEEDRQYRMKKDAEDALYRRSKDIADAAAEAKKNKTNLIASFGRTAFGAVCSAGMMFLLKDVEKDQIISAKPFSVASDFFKNTLKKS